MASSFFTTQNISVRDILRKYEEGDIIIPDYQRKFSYDWIQNNNVITALFIKKNLDSITVIEHGNKWFVADGLHRLNALRLFVKDQFSFCTDIGLASEESFDSSLNEKKFSSLSKYKQKSILDYQLCVDVKKSTADKLDQEIFKYTRLKNTCSIPLSQTGVDFTSFLCSENPNVLKAWSTLMRDFNPEIKPRPLLNFASQLNLAKNTNLLKKTFYYLVHTQKADDDIDQIVDKFIKDWPDPIRYPSCVLSFLMQIGLFKAHLEIISSKEIDWEIFRDTAYYFKVNYHPSIPQLYILLAINFNVYNRAQHFHISSKLDGIMKEIDQKEGLPIKPKFEEGSFIPWHNLAK
jgi:hypothetical protein